MRVKRFLGDKIVYLPCGKVIGFTLLSRETITVARSIWDTVEKFHANVSMESQRRREDWSQCEFHNVPIIVARHKPSRKFWVKQEIAALREKCKRLEKRSMSIAYELSSEFTCPPPFEEFVKTWYKDYYSLSSDYKDIDEEK